MGRGSRSPQNDEVPSAAPVRQRPEEILAQTLTAPPHPEATDGWSSRGRRIFLIAMAVAGVLLAVAGLLVTNEPPPGSRSPTPVQTSAASGSGERPLGNRDTHKGPTASTSNDTPALTPAVAT